jgi:hypothetical protein
LPETYVAIKAQQAGISREETLIGIVGKFRLHRMATSSARGYTSVN